MKDFIVNLSEDGGFRVNDFPGQHQGRVEQIGTKLLAKGFFIRLKALICYYLGRK